MGAAIFYLHFTLLTSGLSGTSVLLGVFFRQYSDASQAEIGALLMSFPFASIIVKPLFCSMADRYQAHRVALILALVTLLIGYSPFIVIPFFPSFYLQMPRIAWYIFVVSSHIGMGGLAVAWSLGEALAMNISQKTKTPYSRMRLMGTVSWGGYGFVIGQINETPMLPKFVPAFLILHASVILEVILLMFWDREDFKMYDPSAELKGNNHSSQTQAIGDVKHHPNDDKTAEGDDQQQVRLFRDNLAYDSTPSSLGGTLRFNAKTASAFKDLMAEDVSKKLVAHLEQTTVQKKLGDDEKSHQADGPLKKALELRLSNHSNNNQAVISQKDIENPQESLERKNKNIQVIILRLLLREDRRLIKYLICYTIFGFCMSPMNFVFLSLPEICKERDCNFSQFAGTLLFAQAVIETLSFLIVPWILCRISRASALGFGFLIYGSRFVFYWVYYSTPEIPPYWAIVAESCHGLGYAIFCTILAETALMFADLSRLFIPEMRRMGLISERTADNAAKVEAEETNIKMALRATMQSLFGGFMDGLGQGTGSLMCGVVVEAYSYIRLWKIFTAISVGALVSQQVIELTKCRWSDRYDAKPGSKACEILTLYREQEALRRGRVVKVKSVEGSNGKQTATIAVA